MWNINVKLNLHMRVDLSRNYTVLDCTTILPNRWLLAVLEFDMDRGGGGGGLNLAASYLALDHPHYYTSEEVVIKVSTLM